MDYKPSFDWFGVGLVALAIITLILLTIGSVAAIRAEKQSWDEFARDHRCRVVAVQDGRTYVGTGLTADGKMSSTYIYEPERRAWLCDDGLTYWK